MKTTAAMLERSRNVFFSQWEELLRLRLAVLDGCEHEDIHDLRVASRRFRAILKLLGPFCDTRDVRRVGRQVRTVTRELGNLRNIDEALAFFVSHGSQAVLAGFIARLSARREDERHQVIETLKEFKAARLDGLVRGMIAGITVDRAARVAIPVLPVYFSTTSIGLFEAIQTFLPAARHPENGEQRHAMRIAIKKWRYFLEAVSRIVERDHGPVLDRLKRYQSLLGSMNDMSVFLEICGESELPDGERAEIERIIRAETARLFDEFSALVESEPLSYSFHL